MDDPRACPAIDALVLEHMRLARTIALRYRDRGESVDDLTQVAYLGLVKAAHRYREGVGANFAVYAVPSVTGEIRKHFRDLGWDVRPPRRLQELRARMRTAEDVLRQELRRSPSTVELAAHLGVQVSEVDEAQIASEGYRSRSLDAPPPGVRVDDWAGADSIADLDGARKTPTDDALEYVVDSEALRPLLARLDERQQLIVALRFFGGCSQQQIAERIGVTQMQVSRLLTQILDWLRREALAEPAQPKQVAGPL